MKNLFKINYLVIAFLLIPFINSCKDDSADEPKSPEDLKIERTNYLAGTDGKAWVLESAIAGGMEVSQFLPACDRDNIYYFDPNGEGEYRSGEIKCEDDEPEVLESGAWELSEDSKSLTMNVGMLSSNAKILELEEERLQVEFDHQGTTGVATFIVTE